MPVSDDKVWLSQITKKIPDEAIQGIYTLFQSWALLEAVLTMWLIALMDVEDDIGRLIVDRFDTRAKISRIKEIYFHLHNDESAKTVKEISSNYEKWVDTRNTIAHKICFGMSDDGSHIMYATGKYAKGRRNEFEMIGIELNDLSRCASFATQTAAQIMRALPPPKIPDSAVPQEPKS